MIEASHKPKSMDQGRCFVSWQDINKNWEQKMLNADNERSFEVDTVPFVHISLFSVLAMRRLGTLPYLRKF